MSETRSRRRIPIWALLILLAIGGVMALVAGLFTYMSVTATPIHPDPEKVTAEVETPPAPKWVSAAEEGRRIARGGLTDQNLPGLAVAVGVDGKIVWAEGFGLADLEQPAPIAAHMRFRAADVSRVLTSAAVGLLVERGQLNLDADIRTYVPDYPQKPWPITLRQLMSGTAGVVNDAGDEEPISEHCERTAEGFKRFAARDLLFEPGTGEHDSSYGWILVSAAVEAAAGQRFFSFMRSDVFTPLGLADTLADSSVAPPSNRATFYYPRFAGDTRYGPELAREGDYSCLAGAYGFLSTPSDLARFAMALERGTLVQPSTLQVLLTPQRLASGQATTRGLGWRLDSMSLAGQPARMAVRGTTPVFLGGTTYLMTFPDRGIVVAIMSNTSFADLKTPAASIAQAFATAAAQSR